MMKRVLPAALAWVALNHAALTRFWFEGESLMLDEVQAFVADLDLQEVPAFRASIPSMTFDRTPLEELIL